MSDIDIYEEINRASEVVLWALQNWITQPSQTRAEVLTAFAHMEAVRKYAEDGWLGSIDQNAALRATLARKDAVLRVVAREPCRHPNIFNLRRCGRCFTCKSRIALAALEEKP